MDGKERGKDQGESRKAGSCSASTLITTENLLCASTNSKGFDYIIFFFSQQTQVPLFRWGK